MHHILQLHLLHTSLSFWFIVTPLPLVLSLASHSVGRPALLQVKGVIIHPKSTEVFHSQQCVFDRNTSRHQYPVHIRVSMAESTKRQNNAGGKTQVATPNIGQLVTLETAMSGAIGGK